MTDNENNHAAGADTEESIGSSKEGHQGAGDSVSKVEKTEKSPQKNEDGSGDAPVISKNIDGESESVDQETPKKVSLFEAPVVIEGKRDRKKTERLTEILDKQQQESIERQEKKFVIPDGKGTKLRDIPYINYVISHKMLVEDLNLLHRLFYNIVGTSTIRKANVRKFCGFDFEEGTTEYEKKVDFLTRVFTQHMKKYILFPLGLKAGKTREETVKTVLDYVMKPEDRGLDPNTLKSKKGKKRKKPSSKKAKSDKPKKKKAKKDSEQKETESGDEDATRSSDDESENEDKDNDDEEPPKKKVKKDSPKKKTPKKTMPKKKETKDTKKKTPKKKETEAKKKTPKKKTPKKESKKPEDLSSLSPDTSDSDDEPLIKKVKKTEPPSDDEVRDVVKRILDSSDLEDLSIRKVFLQVSAMYSNIDMTDRQKFIKKTVKELIN